MIEKIRNKYLFNKTQIIEISKKGVIIATDDFLFSLQKNTNITDFHPFFETIMPFIKDDNNEFTFNCVHLEIDNIKKTVDVLFNSGLKNQNPFIILFDFTEHYNNFQSIAQEKNETVLNFHLEEIKTRQLTAEKEFKNKFLANVGHDLKTPIHATNWFIGMLQKSKLNDAQQEMVSLLQESNVLVKSLVNDVLDLAKIELGKVQLQNNTLSLYQMLNHLQQIYTNKASEKELQFFLTLDENCPKNIETDSLRLNQILINLLDNSCKFTKKGKVALDVRLLSKEKDTCVIQFQVIDTGIGFKPKDSDEVYQSFTKLHQLEIEGSGLGLSIVFNLIKLMNGSITYNTKMNQGTTFTVQLPFKIVN